MRQNVTIVPFSTVKIYRIYLMSPSSYIVEHIMVSMGKSALHDKYIFISDIRTKAG